MSTTMPEETPSRHDDAAAPAAPLPALPVRAPQGLVIVGAEDAGTCTDGACL